MKIPIVARSMPPPCSRCKTAKTCASNRMSAAWSPSWLKDYEVVVGLEVHVQLLTNTKLFSPTKNDPRDNPNENVDIVDVALPGTLPVLNAAVPALAARLGLALGAQVREKSTFARKHYIYPDLPKGYQISQFDEPIVEHGTLPFEVDGPSGAREVSVHIVRAHIEEDAGKSLHLEGPHTFLDYNRAGTPLLEVVTAPDMRTPDEAMECFRALRTLVMALGVCDGNLQEGSMRADANVSVRKCGSTTLGTRAEVKNLNSPRFLAAAVEYEARRQIAELEAGRAIVQETRLFDPDKRETRSMRSKEDAHDYRYFTDPDLPPVMLSAEELARVRHELPELPWVKKRRYVEQLKLSTGDARVLTAERALSDFFEAALALRPSPKALANWLCNDVMAALKGQGKEPEQLRELLSPQALASLVALIEDNQISGKSGKDVLAEIAAGRGLDPVAIVDANGWRKQADTGALAAAVEAALDENPDQVDKIRSGKGKVLGFLVGAVMKKGAGTFDPKDVNAALVAALEKRGVKA
jgi:aspartyl-tRNA(Asn)/glutamyl-tRNA(Gln) amidotransferase subunit B